MKTAPGRERSEKLVDLAKKEMGEGRTRFAIEFAILGSAEAEQHGLEKQMATAQLELARAYSAKGDLDNAIKACIKVERAAGSRSNGMRNKALIHLAEFYVRAGHHQKALDYLSDPGLQQEMATEDRSRQLLALCKARKGVLDLDAFIGQCSNMEREVLSGSDDELKLEILSMLATALSEAGRSEEALVREEQVLQLAIKLDRQIDAAVSANNIGELNQRLNNIDAALKAYAKGIIMVDDMPRLRMHMEANAALAHARSGGYPTGLKLISSAIAFARQQKATHEMPKLLRTLAVLRQLMGEVETALDNALEAMDLATEQQLIQEQILGSAMIATLYENSGLIHEANGYKRKHRALLQQLEDERRKEKTTRESEFIRLQRMEVEQMEQLNRDQHKESYLRQLTLDAENHEKQLALLIYEKQLEAAAYREASLSKDQATKALALTQAALEVEKQERMIQELEGKRLLQSMEMNRLEAERKERQHHVELLNERAQLMEAENRTHQAEQRHQRNAVRFYIAMAGSTTFLALLLLLVWLNTRRKKRTIWHQNQQIGAINAVLAEKDRNIQSSLAYARTIQSAILPTEETLKRVFGDSCLYYRPLDQVSGDLPFIRQVGDTVFLAAIDCTGHGVPAAMLTFIAYYGLNELIDKDPQASSGHLLDRLHERVRVLMKARGDLSLYNDGMDIGLCKLDLRTGKMIFSGAQLSLFVVGGHGTTRCKGDVFPLGDELFKRPSGYTDHRIQLTNGDAIFLFSDGIIHQLGGPGGKKKFSMKRVHELIQRSTKEDLINVKQRTEQVFEEWKADTPQTDDVLFMGMRYAA